MPIKRIILFPVKTLLWKLPKRALFLGPTVRASIISSLKWGFRSPALGFLSQNQRVRLQEAIGRNLTAVVLPGITLCLLSVELDYK